MSKDRVTKVPGHLDPPKASDSDERQRLQIEFSSWQGPIPPPAILRELNELVPNGADRVMRQFEGETAHRHSMERRSQLFPFLEGLAARSFALVFAALCLGVALYAIEKQAYWIAAIFGSAMIVHGVRAFLVVRSGRVPGDGGKRNDLQKRRR